MANCLRVFTPEAFRLGAFALARAGSILRVPGGHRAGDFNRRYRHLVGRVSRDHESELVP